MGCSTDNYHNHWSFNCGTSCSKANNTPNRDTHYNDYHHNDYHDNDRARSG
jgi:hypothetical protein